MENSENKLSTILISAFTNQGFIASILDKIEKDNIIKLRLRISNESNWLYSIDALLREESRQSDWSLHICRQYIVHENKLAYVWNFILQSKNSLESSVRDICRLLDILNRNSSIPKKENKYEEKSTKLTEYPLTTDTRENRNLKRGSSRGVTAITG